MNKLLGAMIVLFAVVLVALWSSSQSPEQLENVSGSVAEASTNGGDVDHAVERPAAPSLMTFDGVVQRPLFIEGRRPPPEQDDNAQAEVPQPPQKPTRRPVADLTAILIVDSEQYAVFRTAGKKKGLEKLRILIG